MEETKKIVKCPKCGTEMNHHADKIIAEFTEEDLKYYNEAFEGIIKEHYKCPGCGATLSNFEKEM